MDTMTNLSKFDVLLKSLLDFFKNNNNLNIFISIVNKNTKISLRILDWLVTNYAKKNNCIIEKFKDNSLVTFKIYLDYKNQLRAYSKNNFDPFCRKNRILFNPDTVEIVDDPDKKTDSCFYTTIGQLNFFRWLINNDIINYLLLNIDDVEKDMLNVSAKNKETKKKRCCLSENNYKKINFYHGTIVVKF